MDIQTISGGAYLPWTEIDRLVATWCAEHANGAWAGGGARQGETFLIYMRANDASFNQGKTLIENLYEKYDTKHEYEPDPDEGCEILPGPVTLGVMNEIFAKEGIQLVAKTSVAIYNGVLFLANELKI